VVDYESLIACRMMGCMAFILCTHDVAGAGGCSCYTFLDEGPAGLNLAWLGFGSYTSASHFPSRGHGFFCTRHMNSYIQGEEDYCVWLLTFSLDTSGSRGFDTIVCYICCTCTCTCTF
jgi:hypothetical protein